MSSTRREGSPYLAAAVAAGLVAFAATAQFGRSGAGSTPSASSDSAAADEAAVPAAGSAPSPGGAAEGAPEAPAPAQLREDGDDADEGAGIRWRSAEAGFAEAARTGKPVIAVFTATWCGQCRTYREHALASPEVVEASRDFVMIQVDVDQEPDVARRHTPDGGYVPRTLFFTPEGVHRAELHAMRPNFQYFVEPRTPTELLTLMARAKQS